MLTPASQAETPIAIISASQAETPIAIISASQG